MIYLDLLEQVNTFVSDDALCGKRLVTYRFCMIFTATVKFSNKEYATEVCCLDIDFESAVSLENLFTA
jgi:hypothetical protein